MSIESKPRIKITYATLRNDNEELHALYEAGVEASRAGLGRHHQNLVGGRLVDARAGTFEARARIDSNIRLGTFAKADAYGCGACPETFKTQRAAVEHALTHTSA